MANAEAFFNDNVNSTLLANFYYTIQCYKLYSQCNSLAPQTLFIEMKC